MMVLNTFEKILAAGIVGALAILVLVELGLLSYTGLPSASNVIGDLGIGFIASASTAIIFKVTNKTLG